MNYSVHDFFKMKTNIPIPLPDYFKVGYIVDPDFELIYHEKMGAPSKMIMTSSNVGYLGEYSVWYECHLPTLFMLGIKSPWKVLLKGLVNRKIQMRTHIPFFNLYPIRYRTTAYLFYFTLLVMHMKLLQEGKGLIHSACLSWNDRGILLPAHSDTGKTYTSISLINSGFKYLSDDYTIIDNNGVAYCWPTIRFIAPPNTLKNPLELVRRLMPIINWFLPRSLPSTTETNITIKRKTKVTDIYILERGTECVQKIGKEEAFRKLFIINMNEMMSLASNQLSSIILSYSYFYPQLDIGKLITKYKNILWSLLDDAEFFLVRCKSGDFSKLILKNM